MLLVLVLGAAACVFSEAAVQTRSVKPDKPRPDAATRAGPGSTGGTTTELQPPFEAPLDEPSFAPQPTLSRDIGGGAIALARDWSPRASLPDRTAVVRVAVPVGAETGAVGLAELTAAVVVDGARTGDGDTRPTLRTQIEQLGGELLFRVDSRAIGFAATVPCEQWRAATEAIVAALAQSPPVGEATERIRHRLVRRLRSEFAAPTLENLARVVTRAAGIPPARYLAGIEDRNQDELVAFHREHFRPAGTVLAFWVPGVPAAAVLDTASELIAPWVGAQAEGAARPAAAPDMLDAGTYWAEAPTEHCAFALVLPVPAVNEVDDLDAAAMLECLTLDGVGGRFETAMGQLPLALHSASYWNGAAHHFALVGTAEPAEVLALRAALRDARRSLAQKPPDGGELRAGAERLRLRLIALYTDPMQWLEWATSLGLRGAEPPDLSALLDHLDRPGGIDAARATAAFGALEPSLVVVGPLPGAGAGDAAEPIEPIAGAFEQPTALDVPLDANDQALAADKHLERALRAAGGVALLSGLSGWTEERTSRSPLGATVEEEIWYRAPDHLRRVRRVLATTIETVVSPASSFERCKGETVELDQDEVRNLLLRIERHPIPLLAAYARGQNRFRLISVRSEGDREMVVLQLLDDAYDHLRLMVDAASGLVRAVERHEWRPELKMRVRITERYGDYRSVGGIRFPFHRTTTIGEGEDDGSTVWRHVDLVAPAPALLQPSPTGH